MLSPDRKRELANLLREANKSGTNIIIGWRRLVYRIELFQLPIFAITDRSPLLSDHITAEGHYIDDDKVTALRNSGCTVTEIEFDFPTWNHQEIFDSMEAAIQPYVVHWHPCRAAALFVSNNLAELRCCVNFGSNFSYQGAMENDPTGGNYIVGDVTIGLARMMSAALPSQLLIGSHSRNISRSELAVTLGRNMLDTTSLLALGQRSIEELNGFTLPGGKITGVKSYLTGARVSANEFSIKKYSIVDKHGLDHECYNAKLNLLLSNGSAVHVGRLDRDLTRFQGTEVGDKGIVIRIH